jgi:hypothetical protein
MTTSHSNCVFVYTMRLAGGTIARSSLVVTSHRMDVVLVGPDAYYRKWVSCLFRSKANTRNEAISSKRTKRDPYHGFVLQTICSGLI